jgi:oligopeptide/dipeptide ABC transporter ATP-binding protein
VSEKLLEVESLTKDFFVHRGFRARTPIRAVDQVSFQIGREETMGLVGESGSGKSTIGRCILRLIEPTSGQIVLEGTDVGALDRHELRSFRRHMQIVFQDAAVSLDPRIPVLDQVAEPLAIAGVARSERRERAQAMLELVGLRADAQHRKPHAFSGGQRQRVAFARALILQPSLLILDEPTSALDVSIQAQVVNLLQELQGQFALTYLFITHDLGIAEYLCDHVVVLYRGAIMEHADRVRLFTRPLHPYTAALLSAVPDPDQVARRTTRRILLPGEPDDALAVHQQGCRFRSRCPVGRDRQICAVDEPPLTELEPRHAVACHFPGEIAFERGDDPNKAHLTGGMQRL